MPAISFRAEGGRCSALFTNERGEAACDVVAYCTGNVARRRGGLLRLVCFVVLFYMHPLCIRWWCVLSASSSF